MNTRTLAGAAALVVAAGAAPSVADDILVIAYGSFNEVNVGKLANALSVANGGIHNINYIYNAQPGAIAANLGPGTEQVFIWDVDNPAQSKLNQSDRDALKGWFGDGKATLIDARSYGLYFQAPFGEEYKFIENAATVFSMRGGGLWVGSDHSPEWVKSANDVLGTLGFNLLTGLYDSQKLTAEGTDYLTTPNAINITGLEWASSCAAAPEGIQPNGMELFRVATLTNFGLPAIVANDIIPAPGAAALLAVGGLVAVRRRR